MNYASIKYCDIANGIGVRTVLFVSGCTNRCEGCFQPETWSFDFGEEFTPEIEQQLLDSLKPDYINGITILGGEPFEPQNQKALLPFLKRVRSEYPKKTIWSYSGFVYENLINLEYEKHCEETDEMLGLLDVLVDGPFVLAKKNISLRFRGSENQRIIDMNKTRETGKLAMWSGPK